MYAGVCEKPSEDELACMSQFGTWETYYYDVDGILMEAAREDGFCVPPEEDEYECITSGGFWQYGYWWKNEWISSQGRC